MTRELIAGACPDPQMLSAYLDGKLDPTERGRIEDHISRCEDCYFVVRETALVWSDVGTEETPPAGTKRETPGGGEVVQATFGQDAATPAAPAAVEAPAADPRRPKASSFARYFMPIAATLVVAAGALALWRQATRVDSYEDAVRPLVDAVGERRFFEPRLTGGFRYGPSISTKRSIDAKSNSDTWGVRAAAGQLIADPTPTIAGRSSRAAAALLTGDVDEAVTAYTLLVQDDPGSAQWPSNLAAALIIRSAQGSDSTAHERDKADALRYAELALRIDPRLPEARFNLGLALKLAGRFEEARGVFARAAAETDSWNEAAREQLLALSEPSSFPR